MLQKLEDKNIAGITLAVMLKLVRYSESELLCFTQDCRRDENDVPSEEPTGARGSNLIACKNLNCSNLSYPEAALKEPCNQVESKDDSNGSNQKANKN